MSGNHKIGDSVDFNRLINEGKGGDILAAKITNSMATWTFVVISIIIIALWVFLNSYLLFVLHINPFDPSPYQKLNLVLSSLAAIQAPIIMISQKQQDKILRVVIFGIAVTQERQEKMQAHQGDLIEAIQILLQDQKEHLIEDAKAREELADDIEEVLEAVTHDVRNITE